MAALVVPAPGLSFRAQEGRRFLRTWRVSSGQQAETVEVPKHGFLVLVFLMVWPETLWRKIHKINGVAQPLTFEWE
jgi:hypothetical protein